MQKEVITFPKNKLSREVKTGFKNPGEMDACTKDFSDEVRKVKWGE